MASIPKRGLKQRAFHPGNTPRSPSSRSRSPITEIPAKGLPRDSDIGSSTVRLLAGESTRDDSDPEDSTPVEAYDAEPNEGTTGNPSIADYRLWTQAAAQFIRSDSGLEDSDSMWIGKRPLGKGGFGMAGLWEKYDAEGNIADVWIIAFLLHYCY